MLKPFEVLVTYWPLLSFFVAFCVVFGAVIHGIWFSRFRHVPGPWMCKITRLWLAYYDVTLQRNQKIHEWHQQYGPVVLIAPGEISFSSVSATRDIYGSSARHPKSRYFDHFISYGERATFNTLDYDEHREKRRITFSFFQSTAMYRTAAVGPIRTRVLALLNEISCHIFKDSASLDFFSRVNLYAFDNITRLLYGSRYCCRTIEDHQCHEERVMLGGLKECEVWNNLLFNFPLAHTVAKFLIARIRGNPLFLTAETKLTEWSTQRLHMAIADCESKSNDDASTEDTLLHRLQTARTAKTGLPLSPNWIAAEMLDNLNAAQTTTTVALTYVLWNLARNSAWQASVRQELQGLPLQDDGLPAFDDVDALPALDACVRESYRINPLSSGRAERVVPIGKEYDGVFLPRGTIVSTSTIAIHHTPHVFPDPTHYDPGRWLHASPEKLRCMEECYIPFGYGARLCLGKAFATVEIKLLVAALLLWYRISEDPASATNVESMRQSGTQDALPKGLRCDLRVEKVR